MRENFIDLCHPHIIYQKANNFVMKFIEEDPENIGWLKDPLKIIHFLLLPKIYNRMNRFGISNKSMLDTLLLLNTFFPPTGDIMKILVLHNHNQYQYQFQNQKKKKLPEIFVPEATQGKIEEGKNPEAYEKRVPHPLEQNPENVDVLIHRSVTKTSFAPAKGTAPTAKALMDTKVAKKSVQKKKLSFKHTKRKH